MKKSKKLLSVLCAVCMVMAMVAPAFAAENLNPSLRTKPYNNTTFTVGADSKSYTLDIVTGEPCIRVWAKNTDTQGSFVVQLINTKDTSKGSTIELAPGESDLFDFTFAGTSDETWKIQISKKSGGIAKVSGMFAVRMESDWTKFD